MTRVTSKQIRQLSVALQNVANGAALVIPSRANPSCLAMSSAQPDTYDVYIKTTKVFKMGDAEWPVVFGPNGFEALPPETTVMVTSATVVMTQTDDIY